MDPDISLALFLSKTESWLVPSIRSKNARHHVIGWCGSSSMLLGDSERTTSGVFLNWRSYWLQSLDDPGFFTACHCTDQPGAWWKLQEMWANEGGRIDFTRFYEQTWKIEWFSSLTQNHRLLRTWRVFSTFGDWYFKCSNSRILRMSTIRKKMPRGIPMPGTEPTPPPSEQWKKGPGCLVSFFRDYTSHLCGDSNKP